MLEKMYLQSLNLSFVRFSEYTIIILWQFQSDYGVYMRFEKRKCPGNQQCDSSLH